jgi:hypothetical protein
MNIRQDKAKDSDEELEELIKDHGIDLSIGERSGEELMNSYLEASDLGLDLVKSTHAAYMQLENHLVNIGELVSTYPHIKKYLGMDYD